jgi:phage repressor protein C with HTH and peptisase S24 domain
MSKETVGERFEGALNHIFGQKNNKEIAEKYNITQQSVGQLKKKKAINETISLICEKEMINLNWIQTGKGEMLLNSENSLPAIPNKALSTDVVSINYYPDVYAAAGYGAINSNLKGKMMTFDRNFIEEFLNVRKIENLDIIRVVGESMEPFIHNGELVLLERSNEARNGETVIANINGEVFVKRFQADPFRKWIRLISDNKLYGDIFLESPEEIQALTIVGIVRAKIKPF